MPQCKGLYEKIKLDAYGVDKVLYIIYTKNIKVLYVNQLFEPNYLAKLKKERQVYLTYLSKIRPSDNHNYWIFIQSNRRLYHEQRAKQPDV